MSNNPQSQSPNRQNEYSNQNRTGQQDRFSEDNKGGKHMKDRDAEERNASRKQGSDR